MKFSLIPLVACSILFSAGSLRGQTRAFDQSSRAAAAHQAGFYQDVERLSNSNQFSNRRASYRTDENPGLPLDSPGHRQFEAMKSGMPQTTAPPAQGPYTNASFSRPPVTPQLPQDDQLIFGGSQRWTNDGYRIDICTVEFINDIEIPALESGQIKELKVREGDRIPAGSVVGQINDELFQKMRQQANLSLQIASQKADDDTSLKAAKNEIAMARVELKRMQNLASKGSRAQSDLEKAQYAFDLANLKQDAALNEQKNALVEKQLEESKLSEAVSRIDRHQIKSADFDTHVMEILRDPLEWVNAGEPVLRVGRMDRLWVNGVINTTQVNPFEVLNKPVTVELQLARGEMTQIKGQIVQVSLERQHAEQLLVKAEIPNEQIQGHWLVQPNSTVSMTIHVNIDNPDQAAAGGAFQQR